MRQTARRPKGGESNQVCQTVKSARAKCEKPTAQVRLPAWQEEKWREQQAIKTPDLQVDQTYV